VPGSPYWNLKPAYLTDEKRKDPPPPAAAPAPVLAPIPDATAAPARPRQAAPAPTVYDAMKATLQAGVRVVAVPQLFPTPRDLARRLVDLADVQPGHRILEPSAGTGAIVSAIMNRLTGPDCGRLVAVEVDPRLAQGLEDDRARRLYATEHNYGIACADFLTCAVDPPRAPESHAPGTLVFGRFDRIVMNPPFAGGADIAHIQHARTFLRPDGRLVAVCANGPRQRAALQPIAVDWIDLPAGSFEAAGTNVNAAIVVLEAA
jgi:SAM-dependent methyltransferase